MPSWFKRYMFVCIPFFVLGWLGGAWLGGFSPVSLAAYSGFLAAELLPEESTIFPPAVRSDAGVGVHVPILVYHSVLPRHDGETEQQKRFSVTPEHFAAELQYLKNHGYTTISLDALADYFAVGKTLPARPVILTFDDGWENQYTNAFPVLKEYGFTATFFIFSNAPDHGRFMSWAQIRKLADAGMSIGGHTKSHPYLFKITDPAKLREEIVESKKIIEGHVSRPVTAFAYPFGHYSTESLAVVKEAGYRTARTMYGGVFHTAADLFTLKVVEATDDVAAFEKDLNR